MTLAIDWIGGNCPVQAEGTIDGKRFYFRSDVQRVRRAPAAVDVDDSVS